MREIPQSWGRFPNSMPNATLALERATLSAWPPEGFAGPFLCYGMGRSYGDVCLNTGGTILRTTGMSKLIHFSSADGTIVVEAGATLESVLNHCIPHGWFVPVLPGTRHVTVGGAIANDIHGKNHHRAGSFGHHVLRMMVLHKGALVECSPTSEAGLFAATIGGLGLTGVIVWAEIQLVRISSTNIHAKRVVARSVEEMFDVLVAADDDHEYTVAWLDAWTERGICLLGNHATEGPLQRIRSGSLSVPRFAGVALTNVGVRLFNSLYHAVQVVGGKHRTMRTEPFFFPLDVIRNWNDLYGIRGMLQYQFVVPRTHGVQQVRMILAHLRSRRCSSYLSVFKIFGEAKSVGMMSFPKPGITVALDFPNTGSRLFEALSECDRMVLDAGGRVYPAKDARLSPLTFKAMYGERLQEFLTYRDPQFSSSFWRRVMEEGT